MVCLLKIFVWGAYHCLVQHIFRALTFPKGNDLNKTLDMDTAAHWFYILSLHLLQIFLVQTLFSHISEYYLISFKNTE